MTNREEMIAILLKEATDEVLGVRAETLRMLAVALLNAVPDEATDFTALKNVRYGWTCEPELGDIPITFRWTLPEKYISASLYFFTRNTVNCYAYTMFNFRAEKNIYGVLAPQPDPVELKCIFDQFFEGSTK